MLRLVMRLPEILLQMAALCAVGTLAHGQATDSSAGASPALTAQTTPSTQTAAPAQAAPPQRHWRFGAALGYGRRTNPVIQSEDIPVIVDLDIAWFGRRWFFDNGDVGFTISDRPRSTTSLVARVNDDRVFFGKTNTRYVNFSITSDGGEPTPPVSPVIEVKPPDRDYAIELGIETLIDGDWGAATLRAFHDVSGTHEGYELSAYYSRRWTSGRLSFVPTLGVVYKSARLNDYYWGVKPSESNRVLRPYEADDGFGFEGGVLANYYLSRNLRIALSLNYERLADDVAASPLAEDDSVLAYFSGLAWTF